MCTERRYKGLIIYHNFDGSKFNTDYYTIVNPKLTDKNGRQCHVHTTTEGLAKQIIDCFHLLRKYGSAGKYQRSIRNKACRLLGMYIKSS